jgi:vacuolar-type H+-ATPase subunit I/STV1
VADLVTKYRTRSAGLLAKSDRQIQALSEERENALEREKSRPIAEVDHLLMQSRALARDHQYECAQETFERAMQRRVDILQERLDACRATYRDQERQLIKKQEQELAVMDQVIDANLDRMKRKHNTKIEVIGYRDRINEFKTRAWPPENYSLGNFRTGRDPERPVIRTARPQAH